MLLRYFSVTMTSKVEGKETVSLWKEAVFKCQGGSVVSQEKIWELAFVSQCPPPQARRVRPLALAWSWNPLEAQCLSAVVCCEARQMFC